MKLRSSGTFMQALKQTHMIAKKYDKPVRLYFILLLVYTSATLLLPLITVAVIDALVTTNSLSQFLKLILFYLMVNIIKVILRAVINIYTEKRELRYAKALQMIAMNNYFEKKGEFYIKNKTGDMMEVLIEDNLQIASFTYQIYRTFTDLVNSIAILSILIYLQWDLALILLVFFPVLLIIQNNLDWKLDDYYSKLREELAKENSLTEEFVSNAALIASHGIKEKCTKKYKKMLASLCKLFDKIVELSHICFGTLECSIILSIAIAMAYEGYKIFTGAATIGILVAFIQYSDFLIEPGKLVASLRVQGKKLIPSLSRISKVYSTADTSIGQETPVFEHFDIEFHDAGFSYPTGKKIFNHVQLKLKSGKTHVIIGASGQGKSTMINLITGLWDTTQGTLTIGGHSIANMNLDYLRKHISLVSQDNLFFNETIRDNLIDMPYQYTDAELYCALKKAGMFEDIMEMPNKLDTELGDRGYALSGGQRQRLAIARALLKDAPIVIFDEPTSALDETTEKIISNTIKSLKNKTVIIITHKKSLMNIGNCIYQIIDRDIKPL